jgi:hypothetical protein
MANGSGICKRCGCPCDNELCAYCTQDRARSVNDRLRRSELVKKGLCCRNCGGEELPVYYSRKSLGRVRRVRVCRNCGTQVTTWEKEI